MSNFTIGTKPIIRTGRPDHTHKAIIGRNSSYVKHINRIGARSSQPGCRSFSLVSTTLDQAVTAPPLGSQDLSNASKTNKEVGQVATLDWLKQWYPVGVLEDLDPTVPHATVVLGKALVVWRDAEGGWRCFDDRCPHRLAALSEGRLDSKGNLFCNYHGWAFSGSGSCTSIPQVPAEGLEKALASPRSCATAHPTACAEGLLWVWLDSSPGCFPEAQAAGAPGVLKGDGFLADFGITGKGWYARKLPVSYVAAKENGFNDPAHDIVLHHGVFSLNRSLARPLESQDLEGPSLQGYKGTWATGGKPMGHVTSQLPCGQRFDRVVNGRPVVVHVAYVVPTTGPWACTLYYGDFMAKGSKGITASGGLWNLIGGKPIWLQHLQVHLLLDADNATQNAVDKQRAAGVNSVYMPAEADALFRQFHKWLSTYGGGGPPFQFAEPQPPSMSREQLLDRLHSHTLHCKVCRDAYQNAQRFQVIAGVLSAVSFFLSCAAALSRGVDPVSLCLLALAGLGSVVAAALKRLEQQFVFVDYDHSHPSKK